MITTTMSTGSNTMPRRIARNANMIKAHPRTLNQLNREQVDITMIGPPIARRIGVTMIKSNRKNILHKNNFDPDQSFDFIFPGIKPGHPKGLNIAK